MPDEDQDLPPQAAPLRREDGTRRSTRCMDRQGPKGTGMSDPFTPPLSEIGKWLDTSLFYTIKRIEGLCLTHIVIGHVDADTTRFRVLRTWLGAGRWQTSVDLENADEWAVFEYLLEALAEAASHTSD